MKTAVVASHHLLQYLEVSGWFPVQFIPFLRLSADFTSPLWVTAAWQRKRQRTGTEQGIKGQENKVGKGAIGRENGERRELHTQHHHQEKLCRVLGVLGHKTSRALAMLLCRTAAPPSNPQSLPSV